MSISSSNQKSNDDPYQLLWIIAIALVVLLVAYYYANTYLKYPAFYLLKYTYISVSKIQILSSYLPDSYVQDLVKEWNQARFVIPNGKAIDHINVSLPFYMPMILVYFLLSIHRYMKYTIPYTYCYKITSFNKLVLMKAKEYPQVLSGYLYGEEMVKNPSLQKFGTYSAEYGPIRYLISIGVISYMGRTLFFKEKPIHNGEIEVPDDPKELKAYAKQLDINVNGLYKELYGSLGKKIESIDDLSDAQIALARAFLIFASGAKNKGKAQKNMKRLASSFVVKNPDGKKETKKLFINRKEEIKHLELLLKSVDDKLIFNSEYQMEFLLSCYAYARNNGADISPPDFLWLKAIERQTYLLLHAYTGDPDVFKNNAYIEILAPMNRWLDLYRVFSLDKSHNMSNKNQTFDLKEAYLKQIVCQISLISSHNGVAKHSDILNHQIKEMNDKQSIKYDIENNKKLHKLIKNTKYSISIDPRLKYRTSKEMILSYLVSVLDSSHSSRLEKEQCINYIRCFSWLLKVDVSMFHQICFIIIIKSNCENITNKLTSKKSEIDNDRDNTKFVKNIMGFDLDFSGDIVEFMKDDDSIFVSKSISVNELYVISSLFVDFQRSSSFSTAEYKMLSKAANSSIDQSVITILYYLTNFEIWLKPEYKVELHEFLGGKIGE